MNPIKMLIRSLLGWLQETVVPDAFEPVIEFINGQLDGLELPEADPRWAGIAVATAEALDDVRHAMTLEDSEQSRAVRAVVEIRFTRAMDELGLLRRN